MTSLRITFKVCNLCWSLWVEFWHFHWKIFFSVFTNQLFLFVLQIQEFQASINQTYFKKNLNQTKFWNLILYTILFIIHFGFYYTTHISISNQESSHNNAKHTKMSCLLLLIYIISVTVTVCFHFFFCVKSFFKFIQILTFIIEIRTNVYKLYFLESFIVY